MKKHYILLFLCCVSNMSALNIVISDPVLKTHLLVMVDSDNDGEISVEEAAEVTSLLLSGNYSDLSGLHEFPNLTSLQIHPQGTAINLSGFPGLTDLFVMSSTITSLTYDNNPSLKHLTLQLYSISNLIVPVLPALETVDFAELDVVTSIDLTNVPGLKSLHVRGAPWLSTFTYPIMPSLTEFYWENNLLSTFIPTNVPNVEELSLRWSHLSSALNLSTLTHLRTFDCSYNTISSLDVAGLALLEKLTLSYNSLDDLDLSGLISLTELYCNSNDLSSLDLLPTPSLERLNCSTNHLTDLSLYGVPNLEFLDFNHNQIYNINLEPVPSLKKLSGMGNLLFGINLFPTPELTSLDVADNDITEIDLTTVPNLTYLSCGYNPFSNGIAVGNLTQLETLECESANVDSLELNSPHLSRLFCGNNEISLLDFSETNTLSIFNGNNNLLTTLDFSGQTSADWNSMHMYEFNNNPLLAYVNVKNGFTSEEETRAEGCPNLVYACADEFELSYVKGQLEAFNEQEIQVNSFCSFTPAGNHNTITATITFDAEGDGCTDDTNHFENVKLVLDNGTSSGSTFTNIDGTAFFYTDAGEFTLAPEFENPYFEISPAVANISFEDNLANTEDIQFCISPIGTHSDLQVTIIPVVVAQPGFDAVYAITYTNIGNTVLSGTASFTFDDAVADFISATITPDSQSANYLDWDFVGLVPFESTTINVTLNINSPMETPAVNIDDILSFTSAVALSEGDIETPGNETFTLNQTVIGSFDPNDKTCLEGTLMLPEMVGEYLHYTIRFQNSGTAAAQNVVVRDVIDTAKYDIDSFQLISSSHAHETRITSNKVEFIFEGINLPAEEDDEPGSHGFVTFKIKTRDNLILGNEVTNIADIFFDYNFPITTNPATTTVSTLGLQDRIDASVLLYPNPTKNAVSISADSDISAIQLYDMQGRLTLTSIEHSRNITLNLSKNASGVYFVKIITANGATIEKVIKQ